VAILGGVEMGRTRLEEILKLLDEELAEAHRWSKSEELPSDVRKDANADASRIARAIELIKRNLR